MELNENKIKLSILILSTHTRRNTFLPISLNMVYGQLEKSKYKENVEILYLVDNKIMTVGEKRNKLKSIASGEYIVFVDDDDRIADTYIDDIVEATLSSPDVISFNFELCKNNTKKHLVLFSIKYQTNFHINDIYYRIPNDKVAIKRSVFNLVNYENISLGEDNDISFKLKPYLNTETKINKVLYYYDYNGATTETQ